MNFKMDFLKDIFSLLDSNKGLPYYQAERRIDIFINLFLEEIIQQFTLFKNAKFIAPEFPLKRADSNRSSKIDYLCFDEIQKSVLFVELKTDKNSFNEKQLEIYNRHLNWGTCLKELQIISSFANKKYLKKFEELFQKIQLIKGNADDLKIHIIYIAPFSKKIESAFGGIGSNRILISFEKLTSFSPSKHQSEWKYFYKIILSDNKLLPGRKNNIE
jgi:hypothetical protein